MCNLVGVAIKHEYVKIKLIFYYFALCTNSLVIHLYSSLCLDISRFIASNTFFHIIICFETSHIMLSNPAANARKANRKSFSHHLTCFPVRGPAWECCNQILTPPCCFGLVIRGFPLLYFVSKWAWAALCAKWWNFCQYWLENQT